MRDALGGIESVLVLGGASDIAVATVEALVTERTRTVVLAGRDPAKLEAVQKFFAYYYSDEAQQVLVDNGQPPVTTYQAQVDAAKNSVFAAVLEAASGLPSPSAQPDLVVPEPVASAMYDSIYGVIQKQLSPQEALQLVQKAFESNT